MENLQGPPSDPTDSSSSDLTKLQQQVGSEVSAFVTPSTRGLEKVKVGRPLRVKTGDRTKRVASKGNVTELRVREDDAKLIHVQYPAIVENPSNALRTMGGIVKVSEAFHHPQKKLELRFRPADVFCNPIHGTGRTTVGILVRVRRKKKKEASCNFEEKEKNVQPINLDEDDGNISTVLEELCRVSGQKSSDEQLPYAQSSSKKTKGKKSLQNSPETSCPTHTSKFLEQILKEEAEVKKELKQQAHYSRLFTPQESKSELATVKTVVKVPKGRFLPNKSNLGVETLGVVFRTYEFLGVSDLQYLPTVPDENGVQVSIMGNIFPGFGDPENDFLYDYESPDLTKKFFPFLLPIHLSHVDKPVPNIHKPHLSTLEEASNLVTQDESVESKRQRRSVYTYMMDFRWLEQSEGEGRKTEVPREPFVQALEDAAKKFYDPAHLERIRQMFQDRPVWTKYALGCETKLPFDSLKYLLPCVAYFSLNGPWRSLWIRFGYDPRKEKTAFTYQLVDFRFPLEYKIYMELDQDDKENYYKFKPDKIPPKSQMFYQLCDIKIPEIEELQGALTVRLHKYSNITVDPKYGYLDEDIMEFCRYCMNRCIEVRLFDLDKIQSVKLPPIRLEAGGSIPVSQLRIKCRKPKKRLRQMPTGRGRRKRAPVPEIAQVTYVMPREVGSDDITALVDYFDDDEEMEEEEVEMYGREYENDGTHIGNLEDCFEDDENDD